MVILFVSLYALLGCLLFSDDRKTLVSRLLMWGVGSLYGVFLSAYYVIPFFTLKTAIAESGYESALISEYSADSLLNAFTLSLPGSAYLQGATLDFVMGLIALVSLGFGLLKQSRRELLLSSIVLFSVLVARGPNPPLAGLTRWMWNVLPYFRYFRPTSRPMVVTAFAYAILLGTLAGLTSKWLSQDIGIHRLRLRSVLAAGVFGLLGVYMVISYNLMRHSLTMTSPPQELLEAYQEIGQQDGEFVFTGVPFVQRRVSVSWAHSQLQDPTKTYGTAFSGKSALGATAIGGISVGTDQIEPIISFRESLPRSERISFGRDILLTGRPLTLFHRRLSQPNYILNATLQVPGSEPCEVGIQAIEVEAENGSEASRSTYRVVGEVTGVGVDWSLRATEPGRNLIVHIGSSKFEQGQHRELHVQVIRYQGMIYVAIDQAGELLLPFSTSCLGKCRVRLTVQASDGQASVYGYSVTPLPPHMMTFAKFLALYNTKYVLIPPEERNGQGLIFINMPGLERESESSSGYMILRNNFYYPRVYAPSQVILVVGRMDSLMYRLADIPAFRFDNTLLLPETVIEDSHWPEIAPLVNFVMADASTPVTITGVERASRLLVAERAWALSTQEDLSVAYVNSFTPSLSQRGDFCLAILCTATGQRFTLSQATANTKQGHHSLQIATDEPHVEAVPSAMGADLNKVWLVSSEALSMRPGDTLTVTVEGRGLLPETMYLFDANGHRCSSPSALFLPSGLTVEQVEVTYSKEGSSRYEVRLNTQEPRFLVLLDRWHSLWRAHEGGTTLIHVPAYNYANAFLVESGGDHLISIRFAGQNRANIGWAVSLLSWIIALVGVIWFRRKQ
ncbi:MAG: hypothetical protein QXQ53_05965 [Candidatus Methanosuratincola sp.]